MFKQLIFLDVDKFEKFIVFQNALGNKGTINFQPGSLATRKKTSDLWNVKINGKIDLKQNEMSKNEWSGLVDPVHSYELDNDSLVYSNLCNSTTLLKIIFV